MSGHPDEGLGALLPPAAAAGRGDRLARVEADIRRAQAEALGRVGEGLARLLRLVEEADRRLDALGESGRRAAEETLARNRTRDEAARMRHYLIVQREALGIASHAPVDDCYPVPGRRVDPRPGPQAIPPGEDEDGAAAAKPLDETLRAPHGRHR